MTPESEIVASLRRRRIRRICHMAPCSRLPGILESGAILSLNQRRSRGIPDPEQQHYWGFGRKEALADYVCCSFMPAWGMLKEHGEEFAILVLDAEGLCTLPGTLFCPTNSAKSDYSVEEIQAMRDIEALDACFPNPMTYQANLQTEILVQDSVPTLHVDAIVFCDDEAQAYWFDRLVAVRQPPDASQRRTPIQVVVGQYPGFRFPADYEVRERDRQ